MRKNSYSLDTPTPLVLLHQRVAAKELTQRAINEEG